MQWVIYDSSLSLTVIAVIRLFGFTTGVAAMLGVERHPRLANVNVTSNAILWRILDNAVTAAELGHVGAVAVEGAADVRRAGPRGLGRRLGHRVGCTGRDKQSDQNVAHG